MTAKREETLHKKRYGQFFSGKEVADMLCSLLPQGKAWESAIDPMAGIGDMLYAVREHFPACGRMLGVEIDAPVFEACAARLPEADIVHADAFSCPALISESGWELVITNPPYVRYQLQNEADEVMPSAVEIREGLMQELGALPHLSRGERESFLLAAKHFSGLSDMAVPAWILCAALVKEGGYLAVVVPETWLNREYAMPVQYLLMKYFAVETVARDTGAGRFSDAEVKTCLVVARRLGAHAPRSCEEETTRVIENGHTMSVPTASLFPNLADFVRSKKWIAEEDRALFSSFPALPYELAALVKGGCKEGYVSLSDLGIGCGQGLRTGANDFFYVKLTERGPNEVRVRSRSWDGGGREYTFACGDVLPALQTRGEIGGLVVERDALPLGVVYPAGAPDMDMARYIAAAEAYTDKKGRHFKELSAVRPNEKREKGEIVREWFRLPKMSRRHLPDLCFTRVSGASPECLYVCQSEEAPVAVDANMVTLWSEEKRTVRLAMALLNSTWCKAFLELTCTVMGGGALKIEASHLKKLLFPKLTKKNEDALVPLGDMLIAQGRMTDELRDGIDFVLCSAFEDGGMTEKLRELVARKYRERSTVR